MDAAQRGATHGSPQKCAAPARHRRKAPRTGCGAFPGKRRVRRDADAYFLLFSI